MKKTIKKVATPKTKKIKPEDTDVSTTSIVRHSGGEAHQLLERRKHREQK